jgi:hypothetical protein
VTGIVSVDGNETKGFPDTLSVEVSTDAPRVWEIMVKEKIAISNIETKLR